MRVLLLTALITLVCGCIVDPSKMTFDSPPDSQEDGGQDVGTADALEPGADVRPSEPDTGDEDTSPGVDVAQDANHTADTGTELDTGGERDASADADDTSLEPDVSPIPRPASCAELRRMRPNAISGPYLIYPAEGVEIEAYCDMATDGGIGYTMVRINGATTLRNHQDAYRAACEAVGMEVIVPRTRAHARSIARFNGGRAPNLVNVFPKTNGAVGLVNWEGRCQGQPCSFYISDTNNSNCRQGFEPNGDNSVDHALYSWDTNVTEVEGQYCFGRWNDLNATVQNQGYVICSTNDAHPVMRASCQDYFARDEVHNAGPTGISGLYTIADRDGTFEVFCDMDTEGGGWTLIWKNTGSNKPSNVRNNEALWQEAASWTPGDPRQPLLPHRLEHGSAVDSRAWHHFKALPHQTWAKFASLHQTSDDAVRHRQSFHLRLNGNRLADIVDDPVDCKELAEPIDTYINGTSYTGQTRHIISRSLSTTRFAVGLASATASTVDCDLERSQVISDTSAGTVINSSGTIISASVDSRLFRYVFSYDHVGTNRNRSRCMYRCWDYETGTNYDAFVWGVRGPLTYVSCDEVRRLDLNAPSGAYLVDSGNGATETTCTF
jgi:hypothetical protein